jgi:hypothetical protein
MLEKEILVADERWDIHYLHVNRKNSNQQGAEKPRLDFLAETENSTDVASRPIAEDLVSCEASRITDAHCSAWDGSLSPRCHDG